MDRCDVVVVGARAAGAATALLLGRLGHDVILVDRAIFPADTPSTHQLARPGVVQLHRWGLLRDVLASGAPAIRQVTFTAADESVTLAVKDKAGVDLLVAPRRYILDTIVADAAARSGVHMDRASTSPGSASMTGGAPPACTGGTAPGPRWRSRPGSSLARTDSRPGWRDRWARRSSSTGARAGRCSMPTSTDCPGPASRCSSPTGVWSGCSRLTPAEPASGPPALPPTPARANASRAAGPRPSPRT